MNDCRQLYLELMKKCLTNWIYGDKEEINVADSGGIIGRAIGKCVSVFGLRLTRSAPFDASLRQKGLDFPRSPIAHTMIGMGRLNNLQFCVEQVLKDNIAGDFIETGVCKGGATIFMAAVLKAFEVGDRAIWVADSFEGLPKPNAQVYPEDTGDIHHTFKDLIVPLVDVQKNFDRYGLLSEHIRFLKGWFKDTLPIAPIERLALLRLDGDMYESTMDALVHLYPKLSVGGYIIIDDYRFPACRKAVHDYRESHFIKEEILCIDESGVYWRRLS